MTTRTVRALLALALLLAGVAALAPSAGAAGRTGTFYVDPVNGNDKYAGTSQGRPWRTLAKVSQTAFAPGAVIRLRSGQTFGGTLQITESGTTAKPITVTTYARSGTHDHGRAVITGGRCVRTSGSHLNLYGMNARNCAYSSDLRAYTGFLIRGDHVRLNNDEATGNSTGILIDTGAAYTTVLRSAIHDNHRMAVNTRCQSNGSGCWDDTGAQGIVVQGTHTTITRNVISNQDAASYDYTHDGSGVEIFGGSHTTVSRNRASNNRVFIEIDGVPGGRHASYTAVAYNEVTSSLTMGSNDQGGTVFLMAAGAHSQAPSLHTSVLHNSVRFTGAGSRAILCRDQCTSSVLSFAKNIFDADMPVLTTDGNGRSVIDSGGYNLVWSMHGSRTSRAGLRSTDRRANPRFADLRKGLALVAGSPAVNRVAPSSGWSFDVLMRHVPLGGLADLGAYER